MIKQLYIAYYRVSTEEQGKSGLGLASQKESVTSFITSEGILMGEFTDIESGTVDTRKGLLDAIEACEKHNAILVVKEISRITRGGYGFRDLLDKANVQFIESESPHDPEVVKDIKFSLAKEERKKISDRTKGALSEIKRKLSSGEVHISKSGNEVKSLGSPKNLTDLARVKSIESRVRKANENPNNKRAGAFIVTLRSEGKTYKEIAEVLNINGFKTSRNKDFKQMQVKRLYDKYNPKV